MINVRKQYINYFIFILLALTCLTPWISAPVALLLGLILAQTIGHPFAAYNRKATRLLLQASVVGLGFGMNAGSALKAGREGLLFTVASIFGTLLLGYITSRILRIDKKTAHLVSCGTAICGGSAIAAIAPVVAADEKQVSVALGTVFILNSIALFLFPVIGHWMGLNETQFGIWSAIAIHDTSSVVGAAAKYGPHALEVATTVKLARALWIIPVAFGTALLFRNRSAKISIPYFIGLFVIAMLVNTYLPAASRITPMIASLSRSLLTLTLFLIGAGLSGKVLRAVGVRPLIQGVILWVAVSVAALCAVITIVS